MEIYRDATIQRFEFTVELFWKSLKKIMEYEKIDQASDTHKHADCQVNSKHFNSCSEC